jgi:hypothetical protein
MPLSSIYLFVEGNNVVFKKKFTVMNFVILYTLDYTCADYRICGLSVHDRKLRVTNNVGGE